MLAVQQAMLRASTLRVREPSSADDMTSLANQLQVKHVS